MGCSLANPCAPCVCLCIRLTWYILIKQQKSFRTSPATQRVDTRRYPRHDHLRLVLTSARFIPALLHCWHWQPRTNGSCIGRIQLSPLWLYSGYTRKTVRCQVPGLPRIAALIPSAHCSIDSPQSLFKCWHRNQRWSRAAKEQALPLSNHRHEWNLQKNSLITPIFHLDVLETAQKLCWQCFVKFHLHK